MAKSKTKRTKSTQPKAAEGKQMDRRRVLRLARNGAVAAVALGAAGVFGTRSVMATIAEHDLTRLGTEGKPTVVQIHDPNCSMCRDLQRETRKALASLDDCAMVYLVANIRTQDGAGFAAKYGAPHVSLLIFDENGALQANLNGVRPREELRQHFLRFGASS